MKKHHRNLEQKGDSYPINGVESGYAFLLFQIGDRATRDKEQFDEGIHYDGEGHGNTEAVFYRTDPIEEWNNSYLKQASDIFKFIMNSNDVFKNNLILSEAKKSISEIKFKKYTCRRKTENTSVGKCISWRPRWNKYNVWIYRNGSKITIGRYETFEEAEKVYKQTIGRTLSEIVDSGLTNTLNL